jgi:hypothetical protein
MLTRVPRAIEPETVSLEAPDNLDRLLGLLERARREVGARGAARPDLEAPYRALAAAILEERRWPARRRRR